MVTVKTVEIKIADRVVRINRDDLQDILRSVGDAGYTDNAVIDKSIDLFNAVFYPGRDSCSGCVEIVAPGSYDDYVTHTGWRR